MKVPTWAGEPHALGPYSFRVLWFRVGLIVGLGLALGGAFALGRVSAPDAEPPPAQAPLAQGPERFVAEEEVESEAEAEEATGVGFRSAGVLMDSYCDDRDSTSVPPLSPAARAALMEAARSEIARVIAERACAERQDQALAARLATKRVSLDLRQTPFEEAIERIREASGESFVLSERARQIVRTTDVEVSLQVPEIPLGQALALVVAAHEDLRFRADRGVVRIESCGEGPEASSAVAYAVGDLLDGRRRDTGGCQVDGELLLEITEDCFRAREGWLEGEGADLLGSYLVVCGRPAAQARVQDMLASLRHGAQVRQPVPAWVSAYETALDSRRVSFRLRGASLGQALDYLQAALGLPIRAAMGVDTEGERISLEVRDLSVRRALSLVLELVDHEFTFTDETLVVVESREGMRPPALRVYDLRDLRDLAVESDSLAWILSSQLEEEALSGERTWLRVRAQQVFARLDEAGHTALRVAIASLRLSAAESRAQAERR